ncbi:MAG: hypothetical protein K9J17_13815 [Flavobacteriales bacterium]|nr:hypothetical protein [Flavobacteriales bacterium]
MLRITKKNQFEALGVFIFHNVILAVVIILSGFDVGIALSLGVIAILDAAPTIYLHWQYYELNKGVEFSISSRAIQVRTSTGNETLIYANEIDRITLNMSAAIKARSHIHFLSMSTYHFAQVHLKNNRPDIIITNLVTPFVEKEIESLKDVPIHKTIQPFNPVKQRPEIL